MVLGLSIALALVSMALVFTGIFLHVADGDLERMIQQRSQERQAAHRHNERKDEEYAILLEQYGELGRHAHALGRFALERNEVANDTILRLQETAATLLGERLKVVDLEQKWKVEQTVVANQAQVIRGKTERIEELLRILACAKRRSA